MLAFLLPSGCALHAIRRQMFKRDFDVFTPQGRHIALMWLKFSVGSRGVHESTSPHFTPIGVAARTLGRPQKLKIIRNFGIYKRPAGAHPTIFTTFYVSLHARLTFEFWGFAEEVLWGFEFGEAVFPYSREAVRRIPEDFGVITMVQTSCITVMGLGLRTPPERKRNIPFFCFFLSFTL